MALHDLRRQLTYEDYCLIPEDGQRHEILDGEHYVTPAPFLRHQRISSKLHTRLGPWIEQRRLGHLFAAPVDVVLSPHDVAQPDLLFVSNERAGIITRKNIQGAPDLVIEILSASTRRRDEGIKLQRYDHLGVPECWMFDPAPRVTKVYRRQGGRLRLVAELSADAGDVLTTPLLPGLEIRLSEVFE
ncbi:MAG TPA: Uma2 family endonuclease [Thermoanaerobaculia bacterium]|jgi:Uma2 family endonuclease